MLCNIEFESTAKIINELEAAFSTSSDIELELKLKSLFKQVSFPEEGWSVNCDSGGQKQYLWDRDFMAVYEIGREANCISILFLCPSWIHEDELCIFLKGLSNYQFRLSVEFAHEDDLDSTSGKFAYSDGNGEIFNLRDTEEPNYSGDDRYLIDYFEAKELSDSFAEIVVDMLVQKISELNPEPELRARSELLINKINQDHLLIDNDEYSELPKLVLELLEELQNRSHNKDVIQESLYDALAWWVPRVKKLTFRRNQVNRYSSFDEINSG